MNLNENKEENINDYKDRHPASSSRFAAIN